MVAAEATLWAVAKAGNPGSFTAMTRRIAWAGCALLGLLAEGRGALQDFEGEDFSPWETTGEAFGAGPVEGAAEELSKGWKDFAGRALASSLRGGVATGGRMVSPPLEPDGRYLWFLVAGSDDPATRVRLVAGDEVLAEARGRGDRRLRPVAWDLEPWEDRELRIEVVDESESGWIAVDHFTFGRHPNTRFPAPVTPGMQLVASDQVAGLEHRPGLEARVVADHARDAVTSPTALAFDGGGRLYVTETHRLGHGVVDDRSIPEHFVEDLASRTVGDRAKLIDKLATGRDEGFFTAKSEKVRWFSEIDPESGRFSRSGIFADDFDRAIEGTMAGVFAYGDVVYLGNIPEVLALRDADGDGRADERGVIQDGFGVRFSLSGHDLSGFVLGPDGRIYGTVGDRGLNGTTREGVELEYPDEGLVFRFDPDGTNFEVVHRGLRNPKELAFDESGRLITVDNNSDQGDRARVVHVVDGGDSGWRVGHQAMFTFHEEIGIEETPPNAWVEERWWDLANDKQPAWLLPPLAHLTAGPSGLTRHPGAGFNEEEAGRFLICDYRGSSANSGVWSFRLQPSGATLALDDARPLVWGLAASDVEYSWDGRVIISDFVGGWSSHEDGRLVELRARDPWRAAEAEEAAQLMREGLDQLPVERLEELLSHADLRIRTRAHLALSRRTEAVQVFKRLVETAAMPARRHAIWGLGVIARRGGAAEPGLGDGFIDLPRMALRDLAVDELIPLVGDDDPEVRRLAVEALGEADIDGNRLPFARLLRDETARVRFAAAIAAGRTAAVGSLPFVWEMIIVNDDRDPYLRHAGAQALGQLSNRRQLMALRTHPEPALRRAAVVALGRQRDLAIAGFLSDPDPTIRHEAVGLIHDRRIDSLRPRVAELIDSEPAGGLGVMTGRRLLHAAFRSGGGENLGRLLEVAKDPAWSLPLRREALRLVAGWNEPPPVDQSAGTWDPLAERDAVESRELLQGEVAALLGLEPELVDMAVAAVLAHELDAGAVEDERLASMVRDGGLPVAARVALLELFRKGQREGIRELLLDLVDDDEDDLAMAAARELIERDPRELDHVVRRAMESDRTKRRQQVWRLASRIEGGEIDQRIIAALGRLGESAGKAPDALEILGAARRRDSPEVKQALADFEAVVAAHPDPLAPWFPALSGGDARDGFRLFRRHPGGQCLRCHRVDGGGHGETELAGPSLEGVGSRNDRRGLLESMVDPSAKVVSGFGLVALTLADGGTVGGALVEENAAGYVIELAGERREIARDEVVAVTPPVSSMPPMAGLLELDEMRDLVEWLSTLESEQAEQE